MNSGRRLSLQRLRERSLAELGFRTAQMGRVILERAGLHAASELDDRALFRSIDPALGYGTSDAWLSAFRNRSADGFFHSFDRMEDTIATLRELDPFALDLITKRADDALEGRFNLLGYSALAYGAPPEWNLDIVRNIRAPTDHWSRIPYLDPKVCGDHKLIWEVNRHQWLVTLGQAWQITGDPRYAKCAAASLESWMDANLPKIGINWASSLEVAFRSIAWLWTIRLLSSSSEFSDDLVKRMVGHLLVSGRHIEGNLSTYFSPNTHLTGEALALYYLGTELSDFRISKRWRESGSKILREQLPIHVREDGTYFEQSTWYLRYTLDFYIHFALLESRNGRPSRELVGPISRLAEALAWILRPDGTFPLIGDDDGGKLLFLDQRPPREALGTLVVAANLTRNGAVKAIADQPVGELVWLCGVEGVESFRGIEPRTPPERSRVFQDGGLVVIGDNWGRHQSVMVVDAGVHGAMNCGHAHADALAFDLTVRGVPIFVDPGTYDYATDPELRDHFRRSSSHNVGTMDDLSSSEMTGPFSWGNAATTHLAHWSETSRCVRFSGNHDGYEAAFPGSTYRRTVVFDKRGVWVIRDELLCGEAHSLRVHLQCAEGVSAKQSDDRIRLAAGTTEVDVFFPQHVEYVSIEDGYVSSLYGAKTSSPQIVATTASASRPVIVTVIAPTDLCIQKVWIVTSTDGETLVVEGPDATVRQEFAMTFREHTDQEI